MIILLEIHEQTTSPEKLERAQYLMALNLAQYQFPTWVLKGWKLKQFWHNYQIGPDTLQLSTDVFLKGGLYLSLPPRKNRLLKSHATPCENCDLMSHFFCSQPMNFQVKKVGQYLCLWVGDGKKPGSRGRYRYGEVRILVLLRTFRLETYLVFSIFQLWEMWVAVAQRWSPGQDSPSEARPRPYAFYLKRHWCENICWPRFPDMILKSITIYELWILNYPWLQSLHSWIWFFDYNHSKGQENAH